MCPAGAGTPADVGARPAATVRPTWDSLILLGALSLEFLETVAVPLAISLVVIALIYAAVYAGSAKRAKRYRPGRPFEFTPVWFLAAPDEQFAGERKELTAAPAAHGQTGGASDRW